VRVRWQCVPNSSALRRRGAGVSCRPPMKSLLLVRLIVRVGADSWENGSRQEGQYEEAGEHQRRW
jgi:hypothetical protein